MANGSFMNNNNRKILLYRGYTSNDNLSSTEWLPPSKFSVGIGSDEMTVDSEDLTQKVPISNGTVIEDGTSTFTGSSGGDDSTDNTTLFKQGGGITDATAQNLIANDTSTSKTWFITGLTTTIDNNKYIGVWIYLTESVLDTLVEVECLEMRIGSNITSDYYNKVYDKEELETGWNWFNMGIVEDLALTGTISGDIDEFQVTLTTSNDSDTWGEDEVVIDLLRQWERSDYFKDFEEGYPSINLSNYEVSMRSYLNSIEANGYNIDSIGLWNKDDTEKLTGVSVFLPESKSETDEFAFIEVDRVI